MAALGGELDRCGGDPAKRRVELVERGRLPLWARRGVTAGSSHATYELKAFMLRVVCDHGLAFPRIGLYIHVDDFSNMIQANPEAGVIREPIE